VSDQKPAEVARQLILGQEILRSILAAFIEHASKNDPQLLAGVHQLLDDIDRKVPKDELGAPTRRETERMRLLLPKTDLPPKPPKPPLKLVK
jgi:hypothetical protein